MAAMSTMGLIAAGVAAAGSMAGGMMSKSGAEAGGNMAMQGAQQSAAMQAAEANVARNSMSPWTSAGGAAVNRIGRILGFGSMTRDDSTGAWGFNSDDQQRAQDEEAFAFRASPGYQFRLDEGTKALDRSAASKGLLLSGAQTKAVQNFGQNLASDEWNNYLNNFFKVSGMGQDGVASTNSTAANMIGGAGNALAQGSAARGSAYAQGANAMASGIGSGMNNALFGAYLLGKK